MSVLGSLIPCLLLVGAVMIAAAAHSWNPRLGLAVGGAELLLLSWALRVAWGQVHGSENKRVGEPGRRANQYPTVPAYFDLVANRITTGPGRADTGPAKPPAPEILCKDLRTGYPCVTFQPADGALGRPVVQTPRWFCQDLLPEPNSLGIIETPDSDGIRFIQDDQSLLRVDERGTTADELKDIVTFMELLDHIHCEYECSSEGKTNAAQSST